MASVLASDGHRSEVADAMLCEGSGQRWEITCHGSLSADGDGMPGGGMKGRKKDKKVKKSKHSPAAHLRGKPS